MATNANPPKHEAFADFVRNKIRSGEWKPGDQLPSQAKWASGEAGHKVLYGSMRAGYIILRTEGWIVGQQGEGVYVAHTPPCAPYNEVKRAADIAASKARHPSSTANKPVATKKRT